MFGAFYEEKLVGRISIQSDGSVGLPEMMESTPDMEVLKSMVAYASNQLVQNGFTPYLYYLSDDYAVAAAQKELGFYVAENKVTCFSGRQEL